MDGHVPPLCDCGVPAVLSNTSERYPTKRPLTFYQCEKARCHFFEWTDTAKKSAKRRTLSEPVSASSFLYVKRKPNESLLFKNSSCGLCSMPAVSPLHSCCKKHPFCRACFERASEEGKCCPTCKSELSLQKIM